jgi:hypothetical protein
LFGKFSLFFHKSAAGVVVCIRLRVEVRAASLDTDLADIHSQIRLRSMFHCDLCLEKNKKLFIKIDCHETKITTRFKSLKYTKYPPTKI